MSRLDLYSEKVYLTPVLREQGEWKGKERMERDQFRERDLGEKWPTLGTDSREWRRHSRNVGAGIVRPCSLRKRITPRSLV